MTEMTLKHLGPIEEHSGFSDPKAYVEHLMTQSGSSFTYGMKILSEKRREAIFAVYAFCRVVDDIADEDGDLVEKRELLNAWDEEIHALYQGAPRSFIGKALQEAVVEYAIPKQEFLLMIDGMKMDVEGPIIAPSLQDLLGYTRRVAGTVGMMSIRIFGVCDSAARDVFALNLADAFQITNILRDIETDAAIDRLYLPHELLSKHNIESTVPLDVCDHPNLVPLCQDLGQIARSRFNEARRALDSLKGEPLRPALIMMGVYEGYLDLMEHHHFDRNPTLYKLSKWSKLARGLRYGFAFPKRPLPEVEPSVPPLATVQIS